MKSFSLYVCLLTLLCSYVFATSAKFSVDFVLTDEDLYPNGEVSGKVYYKYDTEKVQDSKVRYEYQFSAGGSQRTIVELEDFTSGKVFKICGSTCEAYPLARTAQQWWYKSGDVPSQEVDSDGFRRYSRAVSDYGINEIWLKNENPPSSPFNIKKIYFSTGRVLNFVTNTYSTNVNDEKFNPNAGGVTCSVTKCSTFMDLIFVFDSSGSVGSTNWETMKNFVKNVTRQTDVSPESAAIAVVGFGGEMTRSCDCKNVIGYNIDIDEEEKWLRYNEYDKIEATFDVNRYGSKVAGCKLTKTSRTGSYTYSVTSGDKKYCENVLRYRKYYEPYAGYSITNANTRVTVGSKTYNTELPYDRCATNYDNCTKYDERFVSKTYFDLIYTNADSVLSHIQQDVTYNKESGTCQALGLIKVMDILNRKQRVESSGGNVPQRVVIALTDGDDHCAAMTRQYAEILKKNYSVTLIEVGIALETYYDKQLLGEISTHFGGVPSYFDVDSFNGLRNLLDKVVNSVCKTDYADAAGSCNVRCKGFCGCAGECVCPTCRPELSNKCHSFTCQMHQNTMGGCIDTPTVCNDGKHCTFDECNNETGCQYPEKSCTDGLKTCQVSKCEESSGGACSNVFNDNSKCPPRPELPCYVGTCEPNHPDADPTTGCRYEYSCGGKFPVVYDNGQYVSGCYRYTCDESEGQCATADVCGEMSKDDLCKNYTCSRDGMCVPYQEMKCPSLDACLIESKCNSQSGQCETKSLTPDDCKEKFKTEAKNHVGSESWHWFKSEDEIIPYYTCGSFVCDPTQGASSASDNKNKIGGCIFTPADESTCSACTGAFGPQNPTFESCENEAMAKHNNSKGSCFHSNCVKKDTASSECQFTEKVCEPVPCKIATCNQENDGCVYEWIPKYLEMKQQETQCSEVRCIDGQPELVDISVEKCVGDEERKVPVCQLYDHCDPNRGCVYKEKCPRTKNCTVRTCDESQNECFERPVTCEPSRNLCFENECVPSSDSCEAVLLPIAEICGTTDQCHIMTCDPIVNACSTVQIPYPGETDKCHNYICDNNTGKWDVQDKCDDGNICTVDVCVSYDGSCSNFQRDCAEINMTGFGSCFGRACSRARKNGCFRKVYENSYFDECGNCLRGYSAEDSGATESEVSDCKRALTFQEEAAVISAGILAAIIAACIIGAIAVSTAGTLATKELIKRARAVNNSGAHDNPLFEEDGEEMENPTFIGDD